MTSRDRMDPFQHHDFYFFKNRLQLIRHGLNWQVPSTSTPTRDLSTSSTISATSLGWCCPVNRRKSTKLRPALVKRARSNCPFCTNSQSRRHRQLIRCWSNLQLPPRRLGYRANNNLSRKKSPTLSLKSSPSTRLPSGNPQTANCQTRRVAGGLPGTTTRGSRVTPNSSLQSAAPVLNPWPPLLHVAAYRDSQDRSQVYLSECVGVCVWEPHQSSHSWCYSSVCFYPDGLT